MRDQNTFVINRVRVDLANERLRNEAGATIPLRRQCFSVLRHLIAHADCLVTKDELLSAVWPGVVVTEDSLVQCVHEVRRALGDEGHLILKTIPKRGYHLDLLSDPRHLNQFGGNARTTGRLRVAALLSACAVVLVVSVARVSRQVTDPAPIIAQNTQDQAVVNADAMTLNSPESGAGSAETRIPQAQDAILLGLARLRLDTEEDTQKAVSLFKKAIELDPDFGRAYAALAAAELWIVESGGKRPAGAELDASYASLQVNLAKALDRPTPLAYMVAAEWKRQIGRNDEALDLIAKARYLGPANPEVLVSQASILNATGRAPEAEAALQEAMRVDPDVAPATLQVLSVALFDQGKYFDAIQVVQRLESQGVATTDDYITLVSSLGQLGMTAGVKDDIARYNTLALAAGKAAMSVQEARWRWHGDLFSYHSPYVEQLVEGLRKAQVPEGAGVDVSPYRYHAMIHRQADGEFEVEGVHALRALSAGTLFDRGRLFVDVRTSAGYATGHVPGAINLSLTFELSKDSLAKLAGLGDQVVFYCDSQYCHDAAIASAKAVLWGYSQVYLLRGGIPAWVKADCPIEVASR